MIKVTNVISSIIDAVRRRRPKLQVSGQVDIQNVYESLPWGDDVNPPDGIKAIWAESSVTGKAVLLGYVNTNQLEELQKGERRIYSTNETGEDVAAFIRMLNDGTMHVLGTGDFLVRYTPVETAINELTQKLNDHIADYNAHIHTTTAVTGGGGPPGVIAATTSTSTPANVDIEPAKITQAETTPAP